MMLQSWNPTGFLSHSGLSISPALGDTPSARCPYRFARAGVAAPARAHCTIPVFRRHLLPPLHVSVSLGQPPLRSPLRGTRSRVSSNSTSYSVTLEDHQSPCPSGDPLTATHSGKSHILLRRQVFFLRHVLFHWCRYASTRTLRLFVCSPGTRSGPSAWQSSRDARHYSAHL